MTALKEKCFWYRDSIWRVFWIFFGMEDYKMIGGEESNGGALC